MSQVSAHVRLRPVRFAFLVRPNDQKRILEAFRINTCLWGGKYNPVVPFFEQVPKWWDRHQYQFDSATQIINGYLDFFEPDFLVEAERGLATLLGFNEERVIHLSDVLTHECDRDAGGHGMNTLDLYRDLYRREFQFFRRRPHNIVDVVPERTTYNGFSGCVFGSFPIETTLSYFGQAFTDAFE